MAAHNTPAAIALARRLGRDLAARLARAKTANAQMAAV